MQVQKEDDRRVCECGHFLFRHVRGECRGRVMTPGYKYHQCACFRLVKQVLPKDGYLKG